MATTIICTTCFFSDFFLSRKAVIREKEFFDEKNNCDYYSEVNQYVLNYGVHNFVYGYKNTKFTFILYFMIP